MGLYEENNKQPLLHCNVANKQYLKMTRMFRNYPESKSHVCNIVLNKYETNSPSPAFGLKYLLK